MDIGLGMFADRRTPEQIEAEKRAQEKLRAEHEKTLRIAHMVRDEIHRTMKVRNISADECERFSEALMRIAMLESMCIVGAMTYTNISGCA